VTVCLQYKYDNAFSGLYPGQSGWTNTKNAITDVQQVVKVIWHKTASPPQVDGSVVFARWRQCAHMGGHIGATWRIWLNLCFLQSTRVHNPNGKSIASAVSAQLMAASPYTLQWATVFPKITPSRGVGSGPPSNSWFLEPDRADNPSGITFGSAVFAQVTTECPCTLQWVPFSPKIAPSHGGSGLHLTRESLGPSELTN